MFGRSMGLQEVLPVSIWQTLHAAMRSPSIAIFGKNPTREPEIDWVGNGIAELVFHVSVHSGQGK